MDIQQGRTVITLTLGAFNDLFDLYGQRVRKFVAHAFECGLANKFGDHRFAGLVRNIVLWVQGRRKRNRLRQNLTKAVDSLVLKGRNGNDCAPLPQLFNRHEVFQNALTRHAIALGRDRNNRPAHGTQFTRDELVARSDALVCRQAEDHAINFGQGLADHVVQALSQERSRAVISGGINQDQLVVVTVNDAADIVASRLRAPRGDRNLVPDKGVRQC